MDFTRLRTPGKRIAALCLLAALYSIPVRGEDRPDLPIQSNALRAAPVHGDSLRVASGNDEISASDG